MNYSLGIDLGGTRVKAVAVTDTAQVLCRKTHTFLQETALSWAEGIRTLIEQIELEQNAPARRIGLAAPGLANENGSAIACMPGRLQGLENLDWTKFLRRHEPVVVLNDAHSALMGEAWMGAAAGFRNVIMLTLGTGVGGAVICDGRLLRGHLGRAGHLGHICLDPDGPKDVTGTPGSLEDAIGNCTIQQRSKGKFLSTHDLVKACETGDPFAHEIWITSVHRLACAIVSFVNLFDPQAVVIGGGIAISGKTLFEPLEKLVSEYEWRPQGSAVRIIPAALGEFAGAIGAAYNATSQNSHHESQ